MKKKIIYLLIMFFSLCTVFISGVVAKATDINDIKDTEYNVVTFTFNNVENGKVKSYQSVLTNGDYKVPITYLNTWLYASFTYISLDSDSHVIFTVPGYITKLRVNYNSSDFLNLSINSSSYFIMAGTSSYVDYEINGVTIIDITCDYSLDLVSLEFYTKLSDNKTITSPRILSDGVSIKKGLRFGARIEKNLYDSIIAMGYSVGIELSYDNGARVKRVVIPEGVVAKMNDDNLEDENNTYYQFYVVIKLVNNTDVYYTGKVFFVKDDNYFYLDDVTTSFNAQISYYSQPSVISGLSTRDQYMIGLAVA